MTDGAEGVSLTPLSSHGPSHKEDGGFSVYQSLCISVKDGFHARLVHVSRRACVQRREYAPLSHLPLSDLMLASLGGRKDGLLS